MFTIEISVQRWWNCSICLSHCWSIPINKHLILKFQCQGISVGQWKFSIWYGNSGSEMEILDWIRKFRKIRKFWHDAKLLTCLLYVLRPWNERQTGLVERDLCASQCMSETFIRLITSLISSGEGEGVAEN